jgi:glycosyltransferase EpsE
MARISVLMGIYNCAPTLPEALDSLYAQTYQDFKIILCDDGSKDNTYDVAKEYAEKHDNIVLVRNEKNMGLNYTLNHCLEYADTEYCARMDGDDISLPTRFEKEIIFLDEHPEYAVVSVPMIYFDERGDFKVGKGKGEVQKKDFLHGSPICHAPCMYRSAVVKQLNGYAVDDHLLRVEDYNLWFRMYANGFKAYMLSTPLYKMRDDRNAKRRRNWMTRRNEIYAMSTGFRLLQLPWYTQIFALRPFVAHIVPTWLYNVIHRNS